MPEYHGEVIGGPYDGMMLRGHNLPVTIKVDTNSIILLFGTDEEKAFTKRSHKQDADGCYDQAVDIVLIAGEPHDWYDLLSQYQDETLDSVLNECERNNGDIVIHRQYEWTPATK